MGEPPTSGNTPNHGSATAPVKEVAKSTTLSEQTIRDEIARNRIPTRRYGRRVLIHYDGLQSWAKQRDEPVPA
jgi:excisionase family DNA binding protein